MLRCSLLIDPRGAEGYCSCLLQNWMGARLTTWYKFYKVQCHYAPLGKLYNSNVQIVSPFPQSKVRMIFFSNICCAAHTFLP